MKERYHGLIHVVNNKSAFTKDEISNNTRLFFGIST
jgi:hypothetical protein